MLASYLPYYLPYYLPWVRDKREITQSFEKVENVGVQMHFISSPEVPANLFSMEPYLLPLSGFPYPF